MVTIARFSCSLILLVHTGWPYFAPYLHFRGQNNREASGWNTANLMVKEKEIEKNKRWLLKFPLRPPTFHQPKRSHMPNTDGYPGWGPAHDLVGNTIYHTLEIWTVLWITPLFLHQTMSSFRYGSMGLTYTQSHFPRMLPELFLQLITWIISHLCLKPFSACPLLMG